MRVKLRYYLLITSYVPAIMLLNSVFKVFLCGGHSYHPYLIDGAAKTLGSGLTWAICCKQCIWALTFYCLNLPGSLQNKLEGITEQG